MSIFLFLYPEERTLEFMYMQCCLSVVPSL